MNSKTKKTKILKSVKNLNVKKVHKYNKIRTQKIKNKKGGNIENIQNTYSSNDYLESGMFDFMKIKSNPLGTVPNLEMPPMPACCIS